jgi:indole-3-glycerol phosphate synthase
LESALTTPKPRDFTGALRAPSVSVIAEIKRRSPSAGELNIDLDPADLARQYAGGGASCLSVLTDIEYFGGSVDDLQMARAAVEVPVLRKDFTVDSRDVIDARTMGADAILLIVAALSDHELSEFIGVANQLSLSVLVEVHDKQEIQRALNCGAVVIGVNQRNLHTFEIDPHLAETLAADLPANVMKVAESGIRTPDDIVRLAGAGYDAVLVGTSVVTAEEAQNAVSGLVEAGKVA